MQSVRVLRRHDIPQVGLYLCRRQCFLFLGLAVRKPRKTHRRAIEFRHRVSKFQCQVVPVLTRVSLCAFGKMDERIFACQTDASTKIPFKLIGMPLRAFVSCLLLSKLRLRILAAAIGMSNQQAGQLKTNRPTFFWP